MIYTKFVYVLMVLFLASLGIYFSIVFQNVKNTADQVKQVITKLLNLEGKVIAKRASSILPDSFSFTDFKSIIGRDNKQDKDYELLVLTNHKSRWIKVSKDQYDNTKVGDIIKAEGGGLYE